MIKPKGQTILSIRSVNFDGATILEGQKRGANIIKIHYQILTQKVNEVNGRLEWTVVTDNTLVLNGEFQDSELSEAIIYFKKFAVKVIQEMNADQKSNIDDAIDLINEEESK
jgi:hypothetical protein